jgi:hypothetical protein
MRNKSIFLCLLCFIVCSSCRHKPLDVDVSGIQTEPVKIGRFEKDLFGGPLDATALTAKYGDFFRGFVEIKLCANGISDPSCPGEVRAFVSDRDMRDIYTACEKEFPAMDFLESGIQDAFRHFKYYFPTRSLPHVNTMMSGFNYHFLNLNKTIGIGLEWYLGAGSDFYNRLQYPIYKKANMTREHILPEFVKAWMLTEFEEKSPKNDFLTSIVNEGKVAYLLDAMLPKMEDTLKIGFTNNQLSWCKQNEAHIWSFFIQRKVLYSTDYQEIAQFTNEGPFTTGFSKDSPARTGTWIGWQIVRSYMAKNKKVTLQQLMEDHDAQKLLAAAGYKPKL